MWLTSSSIGRKLVMSVTGIALVLFVTFHVLMNAVALLWPTAYNQICAFLGANWYALIASAGLALLFIIHIVYAVWLTLQNRAARGADRYCVTARQPQVEWSSKNMLVLGIVVIAFLAVHMVQFWSKMQLKEAMGAGVEDLAQLNGVACDPAMGTLFLQMAFQEVWTPIVYVVALVALWFHLTHGFWSMFHTIGWDNNVWINRLKTIGNWWTTIVVGLFILQVAVFTYQAKQNFFTENEALQEQYLEFWDAPAEQLIADFQAEQQQLAAAYPTDQDAMVIAIAQQLAPKYIAAAQELITNVQAQCGKVIDKSESIATLQNFVQQMSQLQAYVSFQLAQQNLPQETEEAIEAEEELVQDNVNNQ